MNYENITTEQQLSEFCDSLADERYIAFDTEFVAEDCYRPDLCLIQVATRNRLAIIDTKEVTNTRPFWDLLVSPNHVTVTHAGREEFRFCLRETGQKPHHWVDVQIAAGLIGMEYPASYGNLVDRLLGKSLGKGETRTDWRRRPLSERQLEYAIQDVEYLLSMERLLEERLTKMQRIDWFRAEMDRWQGEITDYETRERWRRVSGISGLKPRQLAIVRELWRWRESVAEKRDMPPRRVLRDDLIIELARRQSADEKRISAIRGMERGALRRHYAEISEAIDKGIKLPDDQLPRKTHRKPTAKLNLLGQFLTTALGSICRRANVATSMVGTAQDVRDLLAYRLKLDSRHDDDPPSLAQGWRAEIVGHVIDELLDGNMSIRIDDPLSEQPLRFEPVPNGKE